MTWLQRYRIRHYVANSIWILPILGMVAALFGGRLLFWIDELMGWKSTLNPVTVELMLGTLASSMFTFIVFVSSALLVSIQLASAQLTPRIIGFAFRDPIMKFSLTWFIFTFTLTLVVLIRIQTSIPTLSVYFVAYSCLLSLGFFLYLMDHVGKTLRPSGALWRIASKGHTVIASTYSRLLTEPPVTSPESTQFLTGNPACTLTSKKSGVILTLDIQNLVVLAQRNDCIIEMVPRVGDFVAAGDPLYKIFGDGVSLPAKSLRQSVAMGLERTMEHDPAYAFRIIVDIAAKALSPAINDPTTAVLALDQLHHLLHNVGTRHLDSGYIRDGEGQIRLIYPTPDWEDYVHLAITEIRHWGSGSIQIVRRMRSMLENLIRILPQERACLLRQELDLLDRTAVRCFTEIEDRALANDGDPPENSRERAHHLNRRNMSPPSNFANHPPSA